MKNHKNNIRLELLCKIHDVKDGTAHQFNRAYSMDFLSMTDKEFASALAWLIMNPIKLDKVG